MKKQLINIVNTSNEVVFPGDVYLDRNRNDLYRLFTICPGCEKKIATMDSNDFNFRTKTYSSVLIHDPGTGGCGWQGRLMNGFFEVLKE